MGVRFKTQGGNEPQKTFSDTFIRANSTDLGPDWILQGSKPINALYSRIFVNANLCRRDRLGGAGNPQPGVIAIPWRIMSGLYGQRQFVQQTLSSATAANAANGIGVMYTPDQYGGTTGAGGGNARGYWVGGNGLAGGVTTLAFIEPGVANGADISGGALPAKASGQVWRLEVIPGATGNLLTVFVNGAQVFQINHTAATRPVRTGVPFMINVDCSVGVTEDWGPFSCGPV